ncbi:hypothetical protein [Ruegeria sp.]|uniref:hypothetical protein n=1 Tax=Ruegeria sp. TaxID=1879320 RepID=UPI003B5B5D32
MRKRIRYSLTTSAILIASVSALYAGGDEITWEQNYLETAQHYCAPQVEALLVAEVLATKQLFEAKIEQDPELPEDQHRAFDKFGSWSVVSAFQVARLTEIMVAIRNNQPVSEQLVVANKALLELSDCLWLSQEDRDLIEGLMLSVPAEDGGEGPEYSSADFVFGALDQAECFRWREASRRILEIAPESKDAETQLNVVLQDTIGQCEEKFEMPFERTF